MDQGSRQGLPDTEISFSSAPILRHPDRTQPFIVSGDASDFALGLVLLQKFGERLHPVAFYSRKLSPAELNYDIHDKELLVIVEAFRQWRYLLEGAAHRITVHSDHKNLVHWKTARTLNRRQARWAQELASMDYEIIYKEGKQQVVPDAFSRRADYELKGKSPAQVMIPDDHFVLALSSGGIPSLVTDSYVNSADCTP